MRSIFWKIFVLFLLVASGIVWYFTFQKRVAQGAASFFQNTPLVYLNMFSWLVFSALFVATVVAIVLIKAKLFRK